ncbi:MAG: FtsW/RodA/SpoVE family cell cycle protein, partial [Sphaerochaetaceae bacterium]|nr:FtsW/RodA/SpoVE family cell cycle protein [Sphaerochaetaceae bacterium]
IKTALSEGSWIGKGMGMGEFKTGSISNIGSQAILANIGEELGFVGIFIIVVLIGILIVIGYRIAMQIRNKNCFYSNLALGITTIIGWQSILNFGWVLGYIPQEGVSLPFVSYGPSIIITFVECAIIYRISKVKGDKIDTEKAMDSIHDELMFPGRNDLENH